MKNNYNTKNPFLPNYKIAQDSIIDKYLPSKQTLKKTTITGLALLAIATTGVSLSSCVATTHNHNNDNYINVGGNGGGNGGGSGGTM